MVKPNDFSKATRSRRILKTPRYIVLDQEIHMHLLIVSKILHISRSRSIVGLVSKLNSEFVVDPRTTGSRGCE